MSISRGRVVGVVRRERRVGYWMLDGEGGVGRGVILREEVEAGGVGGTDSGGGLAEFAGVSS